MLERLLRISIGGIEPALRGGAMSIGCLVLFGCGVPTVGSQVKTRAARDFSCGEEQTQIVDAEGGVYRLSGCGLVASYQCTEDMGLNTRCERLYLSKTSEPAQKPQAGSDLAKSQ